MSRGSKSALKGKEGGGWQCQLKHDGAQYNFLYTDELHAAYHYDLLVKQFNLQEFKPLNGIEKPDDFILRYLLRGKKSYLKIYKGKKINTVMRSLSIERGHIIVLLIVPLKKLLMLLIKSRLNMREQKKPTLKQPYSKEIMKV